MTKQHLARLIAPRSWNINRKENHWTARPRPGPHPFDACVTLNYVLRTLLHHAKTAKEVKYILNQGMVLVDHQPRKDYKFPVGFMDIIQVPHIKEHYRMLFDRLGRLQLQKTTEHDTTFKILKVTGKTTQKKGTFQINLSDGRNFLADNFKGNTGDSVVFDLKTKKPSDIFPLVKGAAIYFTGGRYIGRNGKLLEIIRTQDLEQTKVRFEIDGQEHETLVDYCLAVGKEKPLITQLEP